MSHDCYDYQDHYDDNYAYSCGCDDVYDGDGIGGRSYGKEKPSKGCLIAFIIFVLVIIYIFACTEPDF